MTKFCDCLFNSQIAYIIKNLKETPKDQITIEEYLNNERIQTSVKKGKTFLVCENHNELIKYESETRKNHFKHKHCKHDADNPMTEWHKEWQECFPNTEIKIGNRRADAVVDKRVLEFQHSKISQEDIKARNDNYRKQGYKIFWIIDCNNGMQIERLSNTKVPTYLLTFMKEGRWKYDKFMDNKYIYLHYKSKIFKINPKHVKSNVIEITESMNENDFVEHITNNTLDWKPVIPKLGTIYFNQRGAGCGKTYESIQLLQSDQFQDKEIFIYLTKVHSAKYVILTELQNQYKNNDLTKIKYLNDTSKADMYNLLKCYDGKKDVIELAKYLEEHTRYDKKMEDILYECNGKLSEEIVNHVQNYYNRIVPYPNEKQCMEQRAEQRIKQYVIEFERRNTSTNIKAIIGTIDSFTYAITNKGKTECSDFFMGFVKSIKEGRILKKDGGKVSKPGGIQYARTDDVKLNRKCLIIIDEAQDLSKEYLDAFIEIIETTGIDVYIIGDKLQSIWSEHNVYTYVEKNDIKAKIIKSEGINKVRRFHNIQFKDFVNKIVPFKTCQLPIEEKCDTSGCIHLPQIEGICDTQGCAHLDNEQPYHTFRMPKIYANDYDMTKINKVIEHIIQIMNVEITEHKYLPKNFMFLFPILKGNVLADQLESKLRMYWIKKMKDKQYLKIVQRNDKDWEKNLKDTEYHEYAMLHKSEEGQPINLIESEHYTRLMSIHASKGNGCEVVFLLGLSEKALVRFSKCKNNLIYESLLHVAITRQKRSIYIGIEENGDDIYRRFREVCPMEENDIMPQIDHLKPHKKMSDCISYVLNGNLFNKINNAIIISEGYNQFDTHDTKPKNSIDFNHHLIRYYVFIYQTRLHLTKEQDLNNEDSSQFKTILLERSKCQPTIYSYEKYYQILHRISEHRRHPDNPNAYKPKEEGIPILSIDNDTKSSYYQFCLKLQKAITEINSKIKKSAKKNELPELNPIECVILEYMIQIIDEGQYSAIPIMKIYDIMFHHENYGNHSKEIRDHYDAIERVKKFHENYILQLNDQDINTDIKYNINHHLCLRRDNHNFTIHHTFDILGYSNDCVIHFIIKPQFNELNFNEFMFNLIYNTYLIQLNDTNPTNIKKFCNKKIIACIMSLDSDKVVMFPIKLKKHHKLLTETIKEYLFLEYTSYHDLIYDFYKYLKDHKPENVNSLEYTCTELDKQIYHKIPEYIKDFFKEIKLLKNKEKITNIAENKDIFIKMLNAKLSDEIDKYLKLTVAKAEDCDY